MKTEEENKEQITEKYKIWDVEKKEWFRPVYPSQKGGEAGNTITREILFSQSGEMYLSTSMTKQDYTALEHVNQTRFIPFLYTGKKDANGNRIFVGSLLKQNDETVKVFFNSSMATFDIEYAGGDCDPLVESGRGTEVFDVVGHEIELLNVSQES